MKYEHRYISAESSPGGGTWLCVTDVVKDPISGVYKTLPPRFFHISDTMFTAVGTQKVDPNQVIRLVAANIALIFIQGASLGW